MVGKTNSTMHTLTADDATKLEMFKYCNTSSVSLVYGSEYNYKDVTIIIPPLVQTLNRTVLRFSVATDFATITVKNEGSPITVFNDFFLDKYCSKIILDFDTSQITTWNNSFNFNQVERSLTEIEGVLDFSSATSISSDVFGRRYGLKEVRFAPDSLSLSISLAACEKLSEDSLISIINGLVDMTGETSQTLKLHNTAKAKLTQEQIAMITAKNWTLA